MAVVDGYGQARKDRYGQGMAVKYGHGQVIADREVQVITFSGERRPVWTGNDRYG